MKTMLLFISLFILAVHAQENSGPLSNRGNTGEQGTSIKTKAKPGVYQRQEEDFSHRGPKGKQAQREVKEGELDVSEKEKARKQKGE